MANVTRAWLDDEKTTGDWVRLKYEVGGKIKNAKISNSAVSTLMTPTPTADELNHLLIKLVAVQLALHPNEADFLLVTPLRFD
ncbi:MULTISPECIES: hypothetical protein [unclassified Caballeronia]|uniref:hypothetical protein n=1 Tax=unclassified Caballeronia TaxID=2646786 RepID=UPI0028645D3F|nr:MULTISPECIES: hypothetical protein [unclassified Caballeronia]MDR5772104.1 hypothetical protein [Caballeronia sp. LZ002]MDR5847538.1 hypothetical protein [Caballeronia sp. LZ003]